MVLKQCFHIFHYVEKTLLQALKSYAPLGLLNGIMGKNLVHLLFCDGM
jgi:hypothetical protein